jgi:hypothetical protein
VRVADYFRQAHVEIRHFDFLFLTGGKPEPCGARVCEQYGTAFGVFSRVAPVQVDGRFFTFFRLSSAIRPGCGALLPSDQSYSRNAAHLCKQCFDRFSALGHCADWLGTAAAVKEIEALVGASV